MLQEFDFEVKDRKEIDNQVSDQLSRFEDKAIRELREKAEIYDTLPNEHVLDTSNDFIPGFTDSVNYMESDVFLSDFSFHSRKKFMYEVKRFF